MWSCHCHCYTSFVFNTFFQISAYKKLSNKIDSCIYKFVLGNKKKKKKKVINMKSFASFGKKMTELHNTDV